VAPPRASGEAEDQPNQPPSLAAYGSRIRRRRARARRPSGRTRAREKAERERKAAERARFEANVKKYHRNQRLKGGVAIVGVVGVVAALGYWALSPRTTNAQCVQEDGSGRADIIVPDSYCTGHGGGTGGPSSTADTSTAILRQHRNRWRKAVGGTTIAPKGTTVKTSSGTTIQRGGLGTRFSDALHGLL